MVFLILLGFLSLEYLLLLFGAGDFFEKNLTCVTPGVTGYRPLHNLTSSILSINVPGLNSIMFGPQSSSQLSVILFIWFYYKGQASGESVYTYLSLLSILMIFLSPSNTSVLLLFIVFFILYIFYLKSITHENNRWVTCYMCWK